MRLSNEITASELARAIGAELVGKDVKIRELSPPDEAGESSLVVLLNPKFKAAVLASSAKVVFTVPKFKEAVLKAGKSAIVFPSTRGALYTLLSFFAPVRIRKGIHHLACVSSSAKIGENVYIGPFAVVEDNVEIGDGVQIYPFVFVGEGSKIGNGTIIYPGAVLYPGTVIGDFSVLHAGAVIGGESPAYEEKADGFVRIPQIGTVRIGDRVEIGPNTIVDRATFGETKVGDGTKIGGLAYIGHNVRIGKNTVIVGLTGIGGSTRVGNNCKISGLVGIRDHITIGDNVGIAGMSGVPHDVPPNTVVGGIPAKKAVEWRKQMIVMNKLPLMWEKIKAMEELLEKLCREEKKDEREDVKKGS